MNDPLWLQWAQRLQAVAQTGLAYCRDPFDAERYGAIREIASEMMAHGSDAGSASAIARLFAGDT